MIHNILFLPVESFEDLKRWKLKKEPRKKKTENPRKKNENSRKKKEKSRKKKEKSRKKKENPRKKQLLEINILWCLSLLTG